MNHDTKALLLECGAGVQMALGAIDDVLGQTRDKALEQALLTCRETHRALEKQTKALLSAEHIPEKSANAMARGMSWLKTSTKLAVSPADETVADLITDGCNMGVKSLIRGKKHCRTAHRLRAASLQVHAAVLVICTIF